jgi:hypothetical protein
MLAGNLAYKSEEKKIKASIFFRLQCIMHTVYISCLYFLALAELSEGPSGPWPPPKLDHFLMHVLALLL